MFLFVFFNEANISPGLVGRILKWIFDDNDNAKRDRQSNQGSLSLNASDLKALLLIKSINSMFFLI